VLPPSVVGKKRKLLWGNKQKEQGATASVWSSVSFGNGERTNKFMKLMGIDKTTTQQPDSQTQPPSATQASSEQLGHQPQLFAELERQYASGVSQGFSGRGIGFNSSYAKDD